MSYIKTELHGKVTVTKKSKKTRYLYIKFVYKCYNLHHFYKYKSGITFFCLTFINPNEFLR